MPFPRAAWQRCFAVTAFVLTACAAVERAPTTVAALNAESATYDQAQRALFDASIDRLAKRAAMRGDHTLDILLLSGGGQHGAYGSGFLRGWAERADGRMPRFDLVTGVSTGSLQAPFAVVGTADSLGAAAQLYRDAATESAPTPDYFFWLRRTGGVVDTTRFKAAIARALDARMAEQLAQAATENRQMLVATTDFDLGVGRVWDLPAEIARPVGGLDHARDVMLASCSIPGIFPPVILDDHVHVDGGVVANALFPFSVDHFKRLAVRLREAGVAAPVRVRVWVIMNLWTHARPVVVDPSDRAQISGRSTGVLLFTQQPQLLERLELLAQTVTDRVPGLAMEMRFTAVPEQYQNTPGAEKLFDEAWMQKAESIGYARGQGAAPWDKVVSPYERP
jgi:predicted acylesterase/phospholipase RssA